MTVAEIEAEARDVFGALTHNEWEKTRELRTHPRKNRILQCLEDPPKLAEREEAVEGEKEPAAKK